MSWRLYFWVLQWLSFNPIIITFRQMIITCMIPEFPIIIYPGLVGFSIKHTLDISYSSVIVKFYVLSLQFSIDLITLPFLLLSIVFKFNLSLVLVSKHSSSLYHIQSFLFVLSSQKFLISCHDLLHFMLLQTVIVSSLISTAVILLLIIFQDIVEDVLAEICQLLVRVFRKRGQGTTHIHFCQSLNLLSLFYQYSSLQYRLSFLFFFIIFLRQGKRISILIIKSFYFDNFFYCAPLYIFSICNQPIMEDQKIIGKRSKLSNVAFIKWIRSRFRNEKRKNNQYLYFPQELVKQTSIQKIFVEFDSDGSGGLSRDEVFDMFNSFGICITMEDLNQLYDSVQVNLEELDCNMFKKCALSEESNQVFRNIISKLGKGYFPHNFTNMIIYIVFLSKREQLKKSFGKNTQKIDSKVANMEKILKLNDLALNNQRLANHTQHYKQTIRNNLRDIWQNVNQKHGQRFPFGPKIQEQFYEFCLKNILKN